MDNFQPPQNGLPPPQSFFTSTPLNAAAQNPSMIVPSATLNNQSQTVQLCCNQVRCENQLLRRALAKEREKRQFISRAYQELLRSYETLLDLKNVIDIPSSSSISLSSSDERQRQNAQQLFTSSSTHQQNIQQNQLRPSSSQNAVTNLPIRMAPPRPMQPPQQFQRPVLSIENSLDNVLLNELEESTLLAEPHHQTTPQRPIERHFSNASMQTQATRTIIAHPSIEQLTNPILPVPTNFMGRQLTTNNNNNAPGMVDFGKTYVLPTNSNARFAQIEQQNREKIRRHKSNCADIPRQPTKTTTIAAVAPIRPPPPPPTAAIIRQQKMPPPMERGRAPFREMNMDLAHRRSTKAPKRESNTKTSRDRRSTADIDDDGDDEEFEEEEDEILAEVKARQQRIRTNKSANWYFVPFDENNGTRKMQRDKAVNRRLRNLLANSRARYNAIIVASRRRASIAANRRAVVTDLLKEKRQLDDEAVRVLHTDSSSVSAFPQFMRRMRSASRRTFHRSPVRHQQEEERERLLERATNRILAHSSAAISRVMAKAHIN